MKILFSRDASSKYAEQTKADEFEYTRKAVMLELQYEAKKQAIEQKVLDFRKQCIDEQSTTGIQHSAVMLKMEKEKLARKQQLEAEIAGLISTKDAMVGEIELTKAAVERVDSATAAKLEMSLAYNATKDAEITRMQSTIEKLVAQIQNREIVVTPYKTQK